MSSFDTYCLYNSLNLHFNSEKYDYFKYGGRVRVSIDSFEKRKDKYFFKKLNRKIPLKENLTVFLTANFVEYDKIWIGDLLDDTHYECYLKHRNILESLEYRFKTDCEYLFQNISNPKLIFKCNNDYPKILKSLFRNEISIETVCIISKFLNFISILNTQLHDDIKWCIIRNKIKKYRPFVSIDDKKYKGILTQCIKENNFRN